MIFPLLTGSNVVEVIRNWKALWNNVVRDELRRMTPIQGAGCRIERRAMGTVFSAVRSADGGNFAVPAAGLFEVAEDDGQLIVGPGFVNRNGLDFAQFPGAEGIAPKSGYMCICSEPADKLGNWTPVEAKILAEPNIFGFPVAKITVANGVIEIEQYPVTVAYILGAKRCPIAEL